MVKATIQAKQLGNNPSSGYGYIQQDRWNTTNTTPLRGKRYYNKKKNAKHLQSSVGDIRGFTTMPREDLSEKVGGVISYAIDPSTDIAVDVSSIRSTLVEQLPWTQYAGHLAGDPFM